jgi:hypothetical protein
MSLNGPSPGRFCRRRPLDRLLRLWSRSVATATRRRAGGRPARTITLAAAAVLTAAGLVAVPAGTALAATACQINYVVRNQWDTGFTTDLTINNLGDPINGWTLTFHFPGNQQLTQGWSANWSQAGNAVTATNLDWNRTLGTGAATTIGFNASFSGTNAAPTDFAVNGVACTGPNRPPTVAITSPGANTRFIEPAIITINATASDADGSVARVEFYHDGLLLGSDTTAPYSFTWTGVPAQTAAYHLQAKAFDDKGAPSTVADVPVFVDPFVGAAVQAAPAAVTVPEGGTATFGVKLSQQPSSTVVVSVARTAGDSDITVSSGASLTFTSANWSTAQTVTLAAAEDADQTSGSATITASAGGLQAAAVTATESDNDQPVYVQRFLDQYNKLKTSGYFSPEGVPYHSIETLLVEAPDHGHETTSEAFSFWIWLEAQYGRVTGDWARFNQAWNTMEKYIIPVHADQTTTNYDPNHPATYAPEWPQPSQYPTPLDSSVTPGVDPLYNELTTTYANNDVYGMHWLLDVDNVYGYGHCGDHTTRVAYINTYQRGPQESVWETVAHPSCETFRYGAGANGGYLPLFIGGSYAQQWRYTDAPDADARAIQAAYWALTWATAQGKAADVSATVAKAAKMGDYLRYSFFDKYFKKPGCTSPSCAPGTGKDSSSYLLSWYYAWGGALGGGWSWRIGSSASHQGYQNPLAAWALSNVAALTPRSPTAKADWQTSLTRQLEFYQFLQSAEGAFAGGATNSWDGQYAQPPAGTPTFYGLAYDFQPVFHDPPSNQWFGFQAWSLERVAEYYYVTGDARAKALLDRWVAWALSQTTFGANNAYQFPSDMSWSGAPNTWNPTNPQPNTNLHVTVLNYTSDVGVAAAYARLLTYYGAKSGNTSAKSAAKQLLDGVWSHVDTKGVSIPETRTDYNRFDDIWTSTNQQGLFIPSGYSGVMPNGDVIQPGKSFVDIRSFLKSDPDWPKVQTYLNGGAAPVFNYHRFWAQSDIAMAMADYGLLIGS